MAEQELLPQLDTTLAQVGFDVIGLFDKIVKEYLPRNKTTELQPDPVTNEYERFELWAVNLGLYQPGHASLDYRFRDAPHIYQYARKLLLDLKGALQMIANDLGEDVESDTESDKNKAQNSDEVDSDDGFDDEYLDEYENGSISQAAFVSAVDAIDRLLRLSMKIRNPKTRTGSSNAYQFKHMDPDTEINLIDRYYDHDRSHIKELLAFYRQVKVTEVRNHFLLDRLARANTKRRQQFSYWSYHKLNLVRRSEKTKEKLITVPSSQSRIVSRPFPTPIIAQSNSDRSKPTTVTHLDASKVKIDDAESVISTTSAFIPSSEDEDDIQIPGPPEKFKKQAGLKEFECPYCFTICSKKDLHPSAWKIHVMKDLRPYICTHEDCSDPEQLYDSISDWISHEMMHQSNPNHHTDLQPHEIPSTSISEHRISRDCPFCLKSCDLEHSFHKHVAAHLTRIAIFSLPRSTTADLDLDQRDNASNEVAAAPASQTSRNGDDGSSLSSFGTDSDQARPETYETLPEDVSSRSLEILDKISDLPDSQIFTRVRLLVELIDLYENTGRLVEAERKFLQACDETEKILGPAKRITCDCLHLYGKFLVRRNRYEEAETVFEKELEGRVLFHHTHKISTFHAMKELVIVYFLQGKKEKATTAYQDVIRSAGPNLFEYDSTLFLGTMIDLAGLYLPEGLTEDIKKIVQLSLDVFEQSNGPRSSDTLKAAMRLGKFYSEIGMEEDSAAMYRKALDGFEEDVGHTDPSTAEAAINLARYYKRKDRKVESEAMYRSALDGFVAIYGPSAGRTADVVNELADFLEDQGQSHEAEDIYEQILTACRQNSSSSNEGIADYLSAMAKRFGVHGKLDEAIDMYLQSLDIRKSNATLHDTVAFCLESLASLLELHDKWDEAEIKRRQMLQWCEHNYGRDLLPTIEAIQKLADVLVYQGKLSEAEPLYQEALDVLKHRLGIQSYEVLNIINNLGMVYKGQGKLGDAEKLLKTAFDASIRQGQPPLPNRLIAMIAIIICNLSIVYKDMDNISQAITILEQADGYFQSLEEPLSDEVREVQKLLKELQAEDESTATRSVQQDFKLPENDSNYKILVSMRTEALDHPRAGRSFKAQWTLLKTLEKCESFLGPDHDLTLDILADLGNFYCGQGWLNEAEKWYKRALDDTGKKFGPDHHKTIGCLIGLGSTYEQQGSFDEAEEIFSEALKRLTKTERSDNKMMVGVLTSLGVVYMDEEKYAEAETMFLDALDIHERDFGSVDPSSLATFRNDDPQYWSQHKLDAAEMVFEWGLETKRRVQGESHYSTLKSAMDLAKLCQLQGKTSQATNMMEECLNGMINVFGDAHPETRRAKNYLKFWSMQLEINEGSAKESGHNTPVVDQGKQENDDPTLKPEAGTNVLIRPADDPGKDLEDAKEQIPKSEVQKGEGLLCRASREGNKSLVEDILSEEGNIRFGNERSDSNYANALVAASKAGHLDISELLLQKGANIGLTNGKAIVEAARGGHSNVLMLLFAYGAEISLKTLREAVSVGQTGVMELLLKRAFQIKIFTTQESAADFRDIVALLIQNGADVNMLDGMLLLEASMYGHAEVAKLLLETRANPNTGPKSALREALSHEHMEIIELLLRDGRILGDYSALEQIFYKAASDGHTAIVQLLIHQYSIHGHLFFHGPALEAAISNGHMSIVDLILQDEDFIGTRRSLEYALKVAARTGHKSTVELILQDRFFADKPPSLVVPLQEAIKNKHQSVVDILLQSGNGIGLLLSAASHGNDIMVELILSNRSVDQKWGSRALESATGNGHLKVVETILKMIDGINLDHALAIASKNGHKDVVSYLLEAGAYVNADDGEPLRVASLSGQLEITKLLLDHGADPNWKPRNYELDTLSAAVTAGSEDIVKLLMDKGANITLSALRKACVFGVKGIVEILIDHGADINECGNLALEAAARYGHRDIAELLLAHGATIDNEFIEVAALGGHTDVVELLNRHRQDATTIAKSGDSLAKMGDDT